jgi:ubiquinone/menaquinone biosynthesis C-methylase UbiE
MNDPLANAKAKAEATYNCAADHFDDAPLAFWGVYGRRTVERLGVPPGSSVLDVCCGTGASAIPAAEIVGPNGSVVAVDLARPLLEAARRKAAQRNLRNVEFRVGDMTQLGFTDGAFAAVVIVFGIFFVPDMEQQVRELWRMVAAGGKLAVTTWGPRIFEPMYSTWTEALKRERPDLHTAFNPWDRITTTDAVRKLLLDAGVSNVEVVAEDGWQALSCPEDWWTIALGSGLRWAIEQMSAESRERVRTANVEFGRRNRVEAIETNVIYGVGTKAPR